MIPLAHARPWVLGAALALIGSATLRAQEIPPAPPADPTRGTASDIRDAAKMFDPEAVREARDILARAEKRSHVPVFIETIESLGGEPVDYPTRTKGVVEKCTFCSERLAACRDCACCRVGVQ